MRVVSISSRRRVLKVKIDSEEDLWILRTVLRPGDMVTARTVRDVKVEGGRKERIVMTLKVRVSRVEFEPFTGRLRISGVVVEGPDRFGVKGRHHSLSLSKGQVVELERGSGWDEAVVGKLSRSYRRGSAVIVAIDYEEYGIGVVSSTGFRMVEEAPLNLPGKDDPSRESRLVEALARISSRVVEEASRNGSMVVVVVGPGWLKRDLSERIKSLAPDKKIVVDDASMGGRSGVEEALRRATVARALSHYSIVEAEGVIEEFLREASRNIDMVAHGARDVYYSIQLGEARAIVVIDSLLYSLDDEERALVDEALWRAERRGSKVVIIPEDSPPGEKLKRLGGIIAVLRYPIPVEARRQLESQS